MALTLEIVTPERRVAQTTCDEVRAVGALGGFGIRPGHASLVTILEPGQLTVVTGGQEESYAVGGGFLQVENDRVLVLADTAEPREAIDVARAKRAFEEATERLRSLAEGEEHYREESARVRRATARLSVAGK